MYPKTYCTLLLQGETKQIQELRSCIQSVDIHGNYKALDFDQIIPLPKSLDVPFSYHANLCYQNQYLGKNLTTNQYHQLIYLMPSENRDATALAYRYHQNVSQYNCRYREEWTKKHWGSHGNAIVMLASEHEPEQISFLVYGGIPNPVFLALSEKYPNVTIILHYMIEFQWKDIKVHFSNGKIIQS